MLGGGGGNTNRTLNKTHCLYFAVGIQTWNTTIHGAFTQWGFCCFFPVSVLFVQAHFGGET